MLYTQTNMYYEDYGGDINKFNYDNALRTLNDDGFYFILYPTYVSEWLIRYW